MYERDENGMSITWLKFTVNAAMTIRHRSSYVDRRKLVRSNQSLSATTAEIRSKKLDGPLWTVVNAFSEANCLVRVTHQALGAKWLLVEEAFMISTPLIQSQR